MFNCSVLSVDLIASLLSHSQSTRCNWSTTNPVSFFHFVFVPNQNPLHIFTSPKIVISLRRKFRLYSWFVVFGISIAIPGLNSKNNSRRNDEMPQFSIKQFTIWMDWIRSASECVCSLHEALIIQFRRISIVRIVYNTVPFNDQFERKSNTPKIQ